MVSQTPNHFVDIEKNCAKKMAQKKIEQEGFLGSDGFIYSFKAVKRLVHP